MNCEFCFKKYLKEFEDYLQNFTKLDALALPQKIKNNIGR